MMIFLQLLPIFLSAILIAAHFLRSGSLLLTALGLFFPLLLLVKQSWAARLVQTFLVLAALEWVHTLYTLANMRRDAGEPWLRMAMILGAVTLWTSASASLFLTRTLKKHYHLGSRI